MQNCNLEFINLFKSASFSWAYISVFIKHTKHKYLKLLISKPFCFIFSFSCVIHAFLVEVKIVFANTSTTVVFEADVQLEPDRGGEA